MKSVKEIYLSRNNEIALSRKMVELGKVIITSNKYTTGIVGNKLQLMKVAFNLDTLTPGMEIGTVMKLLHQSIN